MRPGQIWSYTNPNGGGPVGIRVLEVFPPIGEMTRTIAVLKWIKRDRTDVLVLTPEGLPMRKDGSAHPGWKLIEDCQSVMGNHGS